MPETTPAERRRVGPRRERRGVQRARWVRRYTIPWGLVSRFVR